MRTEGNYGNGWEKWEKWELMGAMGKMGEMGVDGSHAGGGEGNTVAGNPCGITPW